MSCKYDLEVITKYFEGNLPKDKTDEISAHLKTCKTCSTMYSSLSLTKKYITADAAYKGNVLYSIEKSLDKDKYRRGKKWSFFLDKLLFNNKNIITSSVAATVVLILIVFTLQNWYGTLNDKKSMSGEEKIFKKLLEEGDSKLKLKEILASIQTIDWKAYENISNGKSFELLNFIYENISFVEDDDIPILFKSNINLDGAYAEQYSAILGELFIRDKFNIVRILSKSNLQ